VTNASFWGPLYEARMNVLFHLKRACSNDPAKRGKAEAWLSRWDRRRGGAAWCCQALGLSPPYFIARFMALFHGTAATRRKECELVDGELLRITNTVPETLDDFVDVTDTGVRVPETFLGFRLPDSSGKLLRASDAPSDVQRLLPPNGTQDATPRPELATPPPALTDGRNNDGIERCRRGHPVTPDNRYRWRGKERCRCCRNDARQRYRASRSQADQETGADGEGTHVHDQDCATSPACPNYQPRGKGHANRLPADHPAPVAEKGRGCRLVTVSYRRNGEQVRREVKYP
jgi:hypothetical protein